MPLAPAPTRPHPLAIGTSSLVAVPSTGLIVYEILFADPFSIETATVPVEVAYAAESGAEPAGARRDCPGGWWFRSVLFQGR